MTTMTTTKTSKTLNKFMAQKAAKAICGSCVTEDYKNYVMKQAELLSRLGISDELSLRKFHHIAQLVPIFVRRATFLHDDMLISAVASHLYSDRMVINNDVDVCEKVIEALSDIHTIVKEAYPQDPDDRDPIPTFNTQKWVKALQDINMKRRLFGAPKDQVLKEVTRGWSEMEINKFSDWVRFYEQGGYLVYTKTANTYTTESGVSVPFMGNAPKIAPIPGLMERDQEAESEAESIQSKLDKKKIDQTEAYKKIRNSIIGRISSAKKLISSEIGRKLVGAEYEKLLASLLQLEKDVLTLKNQSLLTDVIARAEASLIAQGHSNAAYMLVKIAQDANPFGGDAPPPPPEGGGEGDNEAKEALIDTLNEASTWPEKNQHPTNEQLKKEVMQERKEKEEKNAPPPAPAPAPPAPPAEGAAPPPPPPATAAYQWANYRTAEVEHFEMVVEAIEQVIESTKQIFKIAQSKPMLDKSSLHPAGSGGSAATRFFEEDALDKAFANIKLSDVVKRMQAISRVFKNREIARQLSIIDLMLDRLGIAGLFPQLAEATKSALESNQYSSIRIEEVLSKLMSVMDEGGNVSAQLNPEGQKPSLIDDEMQKALNEPEVAGPGAPPPPSEAPMAGVPPLPSAAPKPPAPGLAPAGV